MEFGRAEQAPHIGRPGRGPGTRELVIAQTPYFVPYRVQRGVIRYCGFFENVGRMSGARLRPIRPAPRPVCRIGMRFLFAPGITVPQP
jgi:hypothetical protein